MPDSRLKRVLEEGLKEVPESLRILAEMDTRLGALLKPTEQLAFELINLTERLKTADGIIQGLIPLVRPSQRSNEVYLNACQYIQDTQTSV